MKLWTELLALVSLVVTAAPGQTLTDSSLTVTQIASGLSAPTAFAFLGTNDILFTEKNTGRVLRVIDGVVQSNVVLDLPVTNTKERGLLGMALHPGFASNHLVYLCYTESSTGADQDTLLPAPSCFCITRFEWDGNMLTNGTQIFSLLIDPIVDYHNGGFMIFGPDSKLYVVTGDHNHFGQLQNQISGDPPDDTSVIMRINDDGSIPSDNPFFAQGTHLNLYYAYGVRNSFGLAFDPVTGHLWDTENGYEDYDEINLVLPGFNSGWREIMGPASRSTGSVTNLFVVPGSHYADPLLSWKTTVAPTGLVFLNSDALGTQYRNHLFVGDFINGFLYHFDLNSSRDALVLSAGLSDKVADTASERDSVVIGTGFSFGEGTQSGIVDVQVGPDGRLYVLSIGLGSLYALSAAGSSGTIQHDLTLVSLKPPRKVTLSDHKPSVTKAVKVQIQNRGSHVESIDANAFSNLVTLTIESLGSCPAPVATLLPPKKGFPVSLAPKKKMTFVYNVAFDCANDNDTGAGHEDFRYTATVDHTAIDGNADADTSDDGCPRNPSGSDKGCGGRNPDKTLGADVTTDVAMKTQL